MDPVRHQGVLGNETVNDLKRRSVRGGTITILSQGVKFTIQTGSMIVLAHLLSPADFGLQSMVLAMTGFLGLFRDAGLSMATVQRDVITHEQTSTLFWINVAVGLILASLAALVAPLLVVFFKEPKLLPVTMVAGIAFVFNGLAAQHQALLVRRLRFVTMAVIEVLAMAGSTALGITMAKMGFGYWALIAMAVSGPAIWALAVWSAVPWIPGPPKRGCGIRSMLHLGGTATGNLVVSYLGLNGEKVLLGRFFGAAVLGLYGNAYKLVNLPLQQLSSSIFNVVFPALSRIQNDTNRVCRFFLKSYSLLFSLCVPIALATALFPADIIPVVLGSKWTGSIPILRLLSPTIMAFALTGPLGWFLLATGRAMRNLKIAFLVTPTVLIGISLGLRHGPTGVATGYSTAMCLLVIPVIAWSTYKTGMKAIDIWHAVKGPILAGAVALVVGTAFSEFIGRTLPQIPRLMADLLVLGGTYLTVMLFGMGQWHFYFDLVRQFTKQTQSSR